MRRRRPTDSTRHPLAFAAIVACIASASSGMLVIARPGVAQAQTRGRRAPRAESSPAPQSPSPITLHVTPSGDSLHWSFDLENTSGAPLDVVADRRLLRIEISPSATVAPQPTTTRGTRRGHARTPQAVTCRARVRPSTNEQANRTRIAAGGHYTEGFDLRELCGLQLPAGLVPGASLRVSYGFDTARGFSHAIVFDNQDPPVIDIATASPVVVPGDATAWPPSSGNAPAGDERLHVLVPRDVSAARIQDLHVTARVQLTGHYPLWLFSRPGQLRFEMIGPRGDSISCRRGWRDYNPVRDFFVRMQPGRAITETLVLANLCPPEQFSTPGIYRAQAIFETRASGERFGLQSFSGRSGSRYFFIRIERGAQPGPYQRLPVEDPFAPRSVPRDAGSNRP